MYDDEIHSAYHRRQFRDTQRMRWMLLFAKLTYVLVNFTGLIVALFAASHLPFANHIVRFEYLLVVLTFIGSLTVHHAVMCTQLRSWSTYMKCSLLIFLSKTLTVTWLNDDISNVAVSMMMLSSLVLHVFYDAVALVSGISPLVDRFCEELPYDIDYDVYEECEESEEIHT